MDRRAFAWFVAPSLVMMTLFIALPLAGVAMRAFWLDQPLFETIEVETCTPSFLTRICRTETKSRPRIDAEGRVITRTTFVGLEAFRQILQLDRALAAVAAGDWAGLARIDFWKALRFTLLFTFVTLPFVIGIGLALALAVDAITRAARGVVTYITLLPFIITPVIGALSIRWLFAGDGILAAAIGRWLGRDPHLFGQTWTIEILVMAYRVWHVAPFAFVIFHAGLQTVSRELLESATIDGATRAQRLRHVVVPHLMPLIVFVSLIHLMDSYRVFEEIVGFAAERQVLSLQWLTYDFLRPDDSGNRSITRASASALLTLVGILLLLWPLLRHTWRETRRDFR